MDEHKIKRFTVSLPMELCVKASSQAARMGTTLNGYINAAITQYAAGTGNAPTNQELLARIERLERYIHRQQ